MTDHHQLVPAVELAARNPMRFPNESDAYRRARQALLAEEIELRRHIERVAQLRTLLAEQQSAIDELDRKQARRPADPPA